jgi:hypothetical protein
MTDEFNAPTTDPHDDAGERAALVQRAVEQGVDAVAAVALAEKLSHSVPTAEAYRSVERRLALGLSLQQAEEILFAY